MEICYNRAENSKENLITNFSVRFVIMNQLHIFGPNCTHSMEIDLQKQFRGENPREIEREGLTIPFQLKVHCL